MGEDIRSCTGESYIDLHVRDAFPTTDGGVAIVRGFGGESWRVALWHVHCAGTIASALLFGLRPGRLFAVSACGSRWWAAIDECVLRYHTRRVRPLFQWSRRPGSSALAGCGAGSGRRWRAGNA